MALRYSDLLGKIATTLLNTAVMVMDDIDTLFAFGPKNEDLQAPALGVILPEHVDADADDLGENEVDAVVQAQVGVDDHAVARAYPIDGVIYKHDGQKASTWVCPSLPTLDNDNLTPDFRTIFGDRTVYTARVKVKNHQFLVAGTAELPTRPADRNQLLAKIRPSTNWKGHVILFVYGTRVPFRANPIGITTVKARNAAVGEFVASVSSALDTGFAPPSMIEAFV